jgi:hypothetical protein
VDVSVGNSDEDAFHSSDFDEVESDSSSLD